ELRGPGEIQDARRRLRLDVTVQDAALELALEQRRHGEQRHRERLALRGGRPGGVENDHGSGRPPPPFINLVPACSTSPRGASQLPKTMSLFGSPVMLTRLPRSKSSSPMRTHSAAVIGARPRVFSWTTPATFWNSVRV